MTPITASLGDTILIAQQEGDRPAIVTKVFNNDTVEACGFMPLPEAIALVKIHQGRAEAINAGLRSSQYQAYRKPRV